ncbi:RibD family protein [Streptantibioticus ferralitis]|uniref:Dihydrofolate reductase family protein n=1 Tax=Streptantibioticus ferralitis TaxID=236510 RepID=A0ABT5YXC7_9ACTN|nr:dihydrofolate reductase family protein [Streptantibioticus ferralitis]MDF2256104.1 dihydrofolate reductase family protein [Streptantibioticus ferralitis]
MSRYRAGNGSEGVTERSVPPPRLPNSHESLVLPATADGIDLSALTAELNRRGVRSVLLEGGGRLAAAFAAQDLLDRVVAYVAPVLIGSGGRTVLDDFGVRSLGEARRLRLDSVGRLDDDVRLVLRARPLASDREDA